MSSSTLIRWGGLAAMLSSVPWIAYTLLYLTALLTPLLVYVLVLVAVLLTLVGLAGLHALQKGRYGFIGRVGFYTLFVAYMVQILSIVVFFLTESEVFFRWLLWIGYVGLLVGFVLFGAATGRAGVLPRWCGDMLIIAFPVTIILAPYGDVVYGLVWLVLGYILWSRRGEAGERPTHARARQTAGS